MAGLSPYEEHFYIALPLVLMLMIRFSKDKENPFRRIPLISICLTILCLYMRVSASHRTVEWERLAFPTHLRVDALFAGVTLGYFNHFDSKAFRQPHRFPLWLAGLLLLMPAYLFDGTHIHQHDRADICLCRIWLHRGVGSKPAAVAQPRSEAAGLDWLLFVFDLSLAWRTCDLCFPEASANGSHVCGISLCLYRPWCRYGENHRGPCATPAGSLLSFEIGEANARGSCGGPGSERARRILSGDVSELLEIFRYPL